METKKYSYDYSELDNYMRKEMVEPDELDRYFRGLHTAFTRVTQLLIDTGEMQDLAFMSEESQVRQLDGFFQVFGKVKKEVD